MFKALFDAYNATKHITADENCQHIDTLFRLAAIRYFQQRWGDRGVHDVAKMVDEFMSYIKADL